ncbi:MAG: hypothetical protein ABR571_09295 [Jatrophihabitans sp.]|uniref:hypothetical protein n=1 Tax=Jatrophihabitans sp. TaxID=1932789 RepID=UPI00391200F3
MINGLMVAARAALHVDDADAVLRQVALLIGAYWDDNGRDFGAEVRPATSSSDNRDRPSTSRLMSPHRPDSGRISPTSTDGDLTCGRN